MIQMLVIFLLVCLTTSSKQNSQATNAGCSAMCMQEAGANTKEVAEESILSPINLFMIHAQ